MDMSLTAEQDAVRKAVQRVGRRRRRAARAVERPRGALPAGGARRPQADRLHRHDDPGGVRRRRRATRCPTCCSSRSSGRGDANVRSIVSVHLGLVAGVIERLGTAGAEGAAGCRRWPPVRCSACFGLTEPDYGSDAGNLQATAVKTDGGGYRLNGRKIFITNGTIAGARARSWPAPAARAARASARSSCRPTLPGFTANKIHGKLGLRSCDTAELVLDDVEVGPRRLLGGQEGTGMKAALSALGDGRMSIARLLHRHHAGLPRLDGHLHDAAGAVRQEDRRPPAGAGAHRRHRRRARRRPADVVARGRPQDAAARTTRWRRPRPSCSPPRRRCARPTTASRRYGGYGYVDEYPGGKYLRDARVTTLYEGTSQIQKLIIGRALTGINAF